MRIHSHIATTRRPSRLHAAWVAIALALTAVLPLIHAGSHGVDSASRASAECGSCSTAAHARRPVAPTQNDRDHQDGQNCDTCVQLLLSLNLGGAPLDAWSVVDAAPLCERVGVVPARVLAWEPPRDASPRGPPLA